MEELLRRIAKLRTELDAMRPLSPSLLSAIREPYDFELTHTSNAIEGNTLTLRETTEVISHGVTIGGKPLRDHLEAQDHHHALEWMYTIASEKDPITESVIRQLHHLVLARSKPDIAGQLAKTPRGIRGSDVSFPPAWEVPSLMQDFGKRLSQAQMTPQQAFDAHYRLVTIHPFDDGNGRTARLLMNLMLVRGGYRPVAVRSEDRLNYLDTLERAQTKGEMEPFQIFMHQRLAQTMTDYVGVLRETHNHLKTIGGEEKSFEIIGKLSIARPSVQREPGSSSAACKST